MNHIVVSGQGRFQFQARSEQNLENTGLSLSNIDSGALTEVVVRSVNAPIDYPPLASVVVQGDRVAIPVDPLTPQWPLILGVIVSELGSAGVEPDSVELVVGRPLIKEVRKDLPQGIVVREHNPHDREQLAYLASTKRGTRVYLNRFIVDADVVIPVSRINLDPALGLRGPWSIIFPDLSDQPRTYSKPIPHHPRSEARVESHLEEIQEVNWLLGCRLHVGVIAGDQGVGDIIAGEARAVLKVGDERHRRIWTRSSVSR